MRSISKTITLTTITSVGLILVLGQIVIDTALLSWITTQFDTALESKARALVTLTKFDGSEVELDFADEFMPEFEAPVDPEFFELFLDDGRLLERSNSFDGLPESLFQDQFSEVVFTDLLLPDGRPGRQVSIKFVVQTENEDQDSDGSTGAQSLWQENPRAILRMSRERGSLERTRQQLQMLVFGITAFILLAVVISVPRLTRAGLRPLIRMTNEISEVTPRNMGRRIAARDQPVELVPIASQFNLVLTEIEKAFVRERQFSSDVAHELRTPVSEIRSLAEVGLRWPDEEDIRSYFRDIHDSASHLDKLIENLLYLCRSDEASMEITASEVYLEELFVDVCGGLADQCSHKRISINLPPNWPPAVVVDPQWFELVLVNLMDNAVSYSPPGARVEIKLEIEGGFCRLEINNPMASLLTTEEVEHVFQRFWRKDQAREPGLHTGIGLSLVKSYAGLMDIGVDAWVLDGRFHIVLCGISVKRP